VAQKTRVVRAKSWEELPEVLEPGVYEVYGERFTIVEPIDLARGGRTRLYRCPLLARRSP